MANKNDQEVAQLRQLLSDANTDELAHLSPEFGALLTFLLEHSVFGANVVFCSYCGNDNMPVARTNGNKYACLICYAANIVGEARS